MNYLFKLSLFLLISVFALSSCNSSLSITKRRYSKGFYVHHAGKPAEAKQNDRVWVSAPYADKAKKNPVHNEENSITVIPEKKEQGVLTSKANPKVSDPARQTMQASKNYSLPLELAIKNPVKTIKQLSSDISSSGAAGEALSLLWILLVILLIAYIAGLLLDNFGLGWLIHILLVVILVLLILWLLRIV